MCRSKAVGSTQSVLCSKASFSIYSAKNRNNLKGPLHAFLRSIDNEIVIICEQWILLADSTAVEQTPLS